MGAESDAISVGGQELHELYQFLGVLGHLGLSLVQLRNYPILEINLLITQAIPDSADLKQ